MRTEGPAAPGGFATFSGTAHGKLVHWIGSISRADELESNFHLNSRLLQLRTRNAYTLEGLTPREQLEARNLIDSACENREECACKKGRTIADTSLCRSCNHYALLSRK